MIRVILSFMKTNPHVIVFVLDVDVDSDIDVP
jgi:hypothetical protein